jgi:hypothetical protein
MRLRPSVMIMIELLVDCKRLNGTCKFYNSGFCLGSCWFNAVVKKEG